MARGRAYYDQIGLAANTLVNFSNPEDYALRIPWEATQDTKPDGAWDFDRDFGPMNGWFRWNDGVGPGAGRTYLTFPQDRYEIFAHIAEARSHALGRQPGVRGPFTTAQEVNLDTAFGFGGYKNSSHSSQFLFDLSHRRGYWVRLLQTFG